MGFLSENLEKEPGGGNELRERFLAGEKRMFLKSFAKLLLAAPA